MINNEISDALREALLARFDVTPEFYSAVLLRLKLDPSLPFEANSVEDLELHFKEKWKYLSYALSTNARAKESLSRLLRLDQPNKPKRALDVGCGYGGFLHAFSRQGYDAFGVEIDADLATLSELNTKSLTTSITVEKKDIFKDSTGIGTFDLIVLNDVVEHLTDPIGAFDCLDHLLNPGGVIAIYAPNGLSIYNAISDPHNRVFGASILPHSLAAQLVKSVLKSTGYGLGDYLTLDKFKHVADDKRWIFNYVPTQWRGENSAAARAMLSDFINKWDHDGLKSLNNAMISREIECAWYNYLAEFTKQLSLAVNEARYRPFEDRYIARAWSMTFKKTA